MTIASWQWPLPPWVQGPGEASGSPCRRLRDVLAWPGHSYTTTEDHHGSLWTKKPWPSESNNIYLGLYTAPSAGPEFHICPRCARRERGSWPSQEGHVSSSWWCWPALEVGSQEEHPLWADGSLPVDDTPAWEPQRQVLAPAQAAPRKTAWPTLCCTQLFLPPACPRGTHMTMHSAVCTLYQGLAHGPILAGEVP